MEPVSVDAADLRLVVEGGAPDQDALDAARDRLRDALPPTRILQRVALVNLPAEWSYGEPLPEPDAVIEGHVGVVRTQYGDDIATYWPGLSVPNPTAVSVDTAGAKLDTAAALWAPEPAAD